MRSHRAELEGAKHQKAPPAATAAPEADAPPAAGAGKRSAADKRREKKERAEREAQEAVERFAAASTQGGPRVEEMAAIEAQLQGLQLAVREMPADGSCLFEAVADQLTLHALPPHAARELRTLAAQWMRNHPEDYCAFLETDSGEPMGPSQFDAYCTTMATSNEWGGQMELVALCHALHVRICIHSAGPEVMLDAAGGPLLHVTFHRHYLASGAHYNSAGPPVAEVPWIRQ